MFDNLGAIFSISPYVVVNEEGKVNCRNCDYEIGHTVPLDYIGPNDDYMIIDCLNIYFLGDDRAYFCFEVEPPLPLHDLRFYFLHVVDSESENDEVNIGEDDDIEPAEETVELEENAFYCCGCGFNKVADWIDFKMKNFDNLGLLFWLNTELELLVEPESREYRRMVVCLCDNEIGYLLEDPYVGPNGEYIILRGFLIYIFDAVLRLFLWKNGQRHYWYEEEVQPPLPLHDLNSYFTNVEEEPESDEETTDESEEEEEASTDLGSEEDERTDGSEEEASNNSSGTDSGDEEEQGS
ncbi:hypothetical protein TorRG33x02_024410 [Trema orientale]|uniref:Uncharacterized protein n=1 Tax=Trema orientale TaxID=63057 RepID=A0A2P5FV39_TREOI|nr:hypothetical protein TorRG33x02_024410 [Trema orientale]